VSAGVLARDAKQLRQSVPHRSDQGGVMVIVAALVIDRHGALPGRTRDDARMLCLPRPRRCCGIQRGEKV
jgi:hypothetical protein